MSQQPNNEHLQTRKIEVEQFSNRLALDMGLKIIELARSRNQAIAVEICRLNHTVFLYVDDTLPADKLNWLRRKANVVKQFEESSLGVKEDLEKRNLGLEQTFGLSPADFIAKGGSIPVFLKNSGMIATITVSGLRDFEDHTLILEALQGVFI